MSVQPQEFAKTKIIRGAMAAFVTHGFDRLTMGQIATICGLTRRALYHHFSSKEELFRAVIKLGNVTALGNGEVAARALLDSGASALDVIAGWFDVRFGDVRRRVHDSPHGAALNEMAFRLATDIMIEVSYDTNRNVAELLVELERRGLLVLRKDMPVERAARLLGDGARGVNQARPPIPSSQIARHYREMTEAVLYGCAALPDA
ncbi:MAG TPA: helix-turn-helix domain-containing protein [Rhizomicrobium sp.]|nr:helix-turn-helix domain-containing protein [Rhizomicrobium sp.]